MVNQQGLHARPIGELARTAQRFRASIWVRGPGGDADVASILQMLALQAPRGSVLEFVARGVDARDALEALCDLVSAGFGEP